MKPDNGKGRRCDDVDPRTFIQRSHGELLGVEVSVKYTPGHRIGWNVRQLSNFRLFRNKKEDVERMLEVKT
jgi:hypothetical protein